MNLSSSTNSGKSPLHYAARGDHPNLIQYLLEHNCSLEIFDLKGRSPLFYCSLYSSLNALKYLLENGASPTIYDENDMTPLLCAIKNDSIEVIKILLPYIDINFGEDGAKIPLLYSIACNSTHIFSMLIDFGANPFIIDKSSRRNILHLAVIQNNIQIVNIILMNTSDLCDKYDIKNHTPLHIASIDGNIPIAKALLLKKPEIINDNRCGFTPLHLAVKYHKNELAQFMLTIPFVQISILTYYRQNLLQLSICCRNPEMFEILIRRKIFDPNQVDQFSWSSLHYAVSKGSLAMVRALINAGASTFWPDLKGHTVKDIARARGSRNILAFLENY